MGINNNKDINNFSREEREKINNFAITKENLGALAAEILSNGIEDLNSLSIEDLYNKTEELRNEQEDIRRNCIKIEYKIRGLQAYLNMNLDEKEETETKEKIEKYKKELELINSKSVQNKKTLNAIEAEIETRLNKESTIGELNNRFTKTFNDVQFQTKGQISRIIATVIEKDGEEIGKEIRINTWGEEWECLFRDNDGNFFHKTLGKDDNTGKEVEFIEKISSLKQVCKFLKSTNDKIKNPNDVIEINAEEDLVEVADFYGVPEEIVQEYISKIKKYGKITSFLDENLKKDLGFDFMEGEISQKIGCIYFYVKKICPNRFREILPLIRNMMNSTREINKQYGIFKKIIGSIKYYGDSAYEYLKFNSPFDGSYMKEGISHMQGKYFGETLDQMKQRYEKKIEDLPEDIKNDIPDVDKQIKMAQDRMGNDSMLVQYFENFALEPESINLFNYLKTNPQKLDNLGGKEIKSIDLSIDSGINFAFRGIIEMVKSRPDIKFPHLNENASELEKSNRSQERGKIIKEYENMLRDYIAKDKKEDLGHFNKMFVSTSQGYMGFSDDKDAYFMPSKEWAQQFSGSEVADYSDDDEKYMRKETEEIKMISDIENYVREHPDEKVLVCINHHGGNDGSSGNGWTKEDWIRLANISPNVKIRSIRCYFGTAFTNREIYEQLSPVSGFSNNTVTFAAVGEIITDAFNKGLGFHETEIYTRLYYPVSVSPLTESMEYTDWNTGEKEMRNIGLARNNESNRDDIHYNDYSHSV